ncbi:MAG TPA: hypothetical protein VKI65_13090, partial [Gemmataceae bacterium]|nr:hypothetical protein [Gemmataceae bacterium]
MADSPGLTGPEPASPSATGRRESWLRRPDPKTAEQEFERLRTLLAGQIERDELREARQTAAGMICLKPDDADALEVFTYLDKELTQLDAPPPPPAPEPARAIQCIAAHANEILALAVSPDGRFIMSAAGDSPANPGAPPAKPGAPPATPGAPPAGNDFGFRLWDVATGKEVRRLHGHTSVTTSLVYGSGGRHVLSGNRGGTLGLWEVETGRLTQRFKGRVKFVTAVAL